MPERTIWYMSQSVHHQDQDDGRLHVSAEATAQAPLEAVWALVSDVARYSEWGPWSATGYRQPGTDSPRGPGAVQWLRSARRTYLRYTTSVERILESDPAGHLVYEVIGGIPVRNYRAEVTLVPTAGGTRIQWTAAWDSTLRGRLVWRTLRVFYPEIVAALAAAAERQAARTAP
jgi:carbon monoxide dehydrogenase subunit G